LKSCHLKNETKFFWLKFDAQDTHLTMKFGFHATMICSLAFALSSCKKPEPPQQGPLQVTVAPVIQKDVLSTSKWVGLLDGYQNSNIQAQVTGYLLTQNYQEGSNVKKGDVLFTIDPRPFEAALAQAQANYASAVAKAQLQQITLDRQTQLFKTKVISEQEYQTSYQDTQASLANVAASQAAVQSAQVNLGYCTITAPFDGVAGVAQAQIGDLVGPGGRTSILTQASQIDPMKINFFITEGEYLDASELLQKLQSMPKQDIKGRLSLKLADGSVYPTLGRFDFFNRQVNSSTGTIQITGLFSNPQGMLRPGLFAQVTAPVKELNNALLVPQKATVELQGNFFVAIVQPDSTIKSVAVKLGPVEGDLQVVSGSLQAGDNVVVEGVEKVRAGMKVVAKPYQPSGTPSETPVKTADTTPAASPAPTK
jgi:membrane fusion protein (multidrug efflux system)